MSSLSLVPWWTIASRWEAIQSSHKNITYKSSSWSYLQIFWKYLTGGTSTEWNVKIGSVRRQAIWKSECLFHIQRLHQDLKIFSRNWQTRELDYCLDLLWYEKICLFKISKSNPDVPWNNFFWKIRCLWVYDIFNKLFLKYILLHSLLFLVLKAARVNYIWIKLHILLHNLF